MPRKTSPYAKLPSKIFVTGGAGFIGSHVVKRLVELGREVVCLVLPHDKALALDGVPYERVDGDLSSEDKLAEAMEGCGLVIHLAAIYALWLDRPEMMYEVNVVGTANIMNAARMVGIKRVVHTSSIAAVGILPGQGIADETTHFNDWNDSDHYVFSKYIAELEALRHNGDDLEVVAVNPAFPFGADDRAPTPTGKMIVNALTGKMPFSLNGGFNAVYVGDVAEGHLLAAVKGTPGERYLLSGHNLTYNAFTKELADLSGRRAPSITVPSTVARGLGWAAEQVANHVTRQAPMATYRSINYIAGRHLYFSCEKAKRELGYPVTPLRDALRAAIDWFEPRLSQF